MSAAATTTLISGAWLSSVLAAYTQSVGEPYELSKNAQGKRPHAEPSEEAGAARGDDSTGNFPTQPKQQKLKLVLQRPALPAIAAPLPAPPSAPQFVTAFEVDNDEEEAAESVRRGPSNTLANGSRGTAFSSPPALTLEAAIASGGSIPLGTLDSEVEAVRQSIAAAIPGGGSSSSSSSAGGLWGEDNGFAPAPHRERRTTPSSLRTDAAQARATSAALAATAEALASASARARELSTALSGEFNWVSSALAASIDPSLAVELRAAESRRATQERQLSALERSHAGSMHSSTRLNEDDDVGDNAAAQPSPALLRDDIFAQAMYGVSAGHAAAIVAGNVPRDAPLGAAGERIRARGNMIGTAAAAAAARGSPASGSLVHAIPALELQVFPKYYPPAMLRAWHRGQPPSLQPHVRVLARGSRLTTLSGTAAARGGATPLIGLNASTRYDAFAAANLSGSHAPTPVSGGVRVGSRSFAIKRKDDLSIRDGPFILLEYSEQRPPLMTAPGMASRLITYVRRGAAAGSAAGAAASDKGRGASAATDVDSDSDDGDEEYGARGPTSSSSSAAAAAASGASSTAASSFVKLGELEILGPKATFPLLGTLEQGEQITALSTGLFAAPVFKHTARSTDFLLVLRNEKTSSSSTSGGLRLEGALSPLRPPPPAAEPSHSTTPNSTAAAAADTPVAYIREIDKLFTVGQEEPRMEVFRPSTRGKGHTFVPYPGTRDFLRAYVSYKLLLWFAAEDEKLRVEATEAKAKAEKVRKQKAGGGKGAAQVGAGDGSTPAGAAAAAAAAVAAEHQYSMGMLLLRDVLRAFNYAGSADEFLKLTEEVAELDTVTGVLHRRRDAPSPEDWREARGLTPERVCLYEALRAGEEALRSAGLSVLQIDDRVLEEALRKLQELYDGMVGRLKSTSGGVGGGASDGDDDVAGTAAAAEAAASSSLWMHDGGYRRLRRTLEVAQAITYLLQTTPWAAAHNYLSYSQRGDATMLALQDPGGVGDPSGRGEAFSFIRDAGQRRVQNALSNSAGAGLMPFSKKEGTDRDARALTMLQMAEMLTAMEVRPEKIRKMKRWDRVRAIREKQNEQLSLARDGSAGSSSASLLFVGELRLSALDRRRIKEEQASEIQRRQIDALSCVVPPALGEDEAESESDTDEEFASFAEELERGMDENIRAAKQRADAAFPGRGGHRGGGDATSRTAALAEADEQAEFEQFLRHLKQDGGPSSRDRARSSSASSASSSSSSAAAGGQPAPTSFPLPLMLLRPPHAPLLSSTWNPSGGGSAAAAGASPSLRRAGAGALSTSSRTGALNPMHLGALTEPPRPPQFTFNALLVGTPVPPTAATAAAAAAGWSSSAPQQLLSEGARNSGIRGGNNDGALGSGWSATGKILRIIRSTVDADGKQVVRVTYSTNEYALAQVWLKQRLRIDLGVLGVRQSAGTTSTSAAHRASSSLTSSSASSSSALAAGAAGDGSSASRASSLDSTLKGLVETGLFAPTRGGSGYTGRFRSVIEREREVDRIFNMYTWLGRMGFVLDGSRGGREERRARRVTIHGTPVPVCSSCRMWGHQNSGASSVSNVMCPFTAVHKRSGGGGGGGAAPGTTAARGSAGGHVSGGSAVGSSGLTDEQFAQMRSAAIGGPKLKISEEDMALIREAVAAKERRVSRYAGTSSSTRGTAAAGAVPSSTSSGALLSGGIAGAAAGATASGAAAASKSGLGTASSARAVSDVSFRLPPVWFVRVHYEYLFGVLRMCAVHALLTYYLDLCYSRSRAILVLFCSETARSPRSAH